MKYNRRKWPGRALVLGATLLANATAAEVPRAGNLHEEGLQAERDCKPLLLEFSAASCSYCRLLEEEVLNPTLLDHEYDRRVLIRQVQIDGGGQMTDFDGRNRISPARLAERYGIQVTPTLVFVDSRGEELAERMVGVLTLDFYGAYLDAALDISRERLEAMNRCPADAS